MDTTNKEHHARDEQYEHHQQRKQPHDEASPFLPTLHRASQGAGLLQLDAAHPP